MKNNKPIPFEKVRDLFRSGELWHKKPEDLTRCLRGLASMAEENSYIRHHYTIIAAAIQGIFLEHIIVKIDKRNTTLTYVLIAIGIIAIVISIIAITVTVLD